MSDPARRTGSETRAEAQRVALSLFTSQGYEATSLRQIAEALGISKAALYYHFRSKEDIVRQGMAERGDEAAELLAWAQSQARSQEPSPELLERAVLRWVESASVEKLRGIRFATVNPALMRSFHDASGVGGSLDALATLLAGPNAEPQRQLLVRMAVLSLNSAVTAAAGTTLSDAEVAATAREAARAILERLRELSPATSQPSGRQ